MAIVHKNSRKRNAILAALCSTETHPSAEWICARLRAEYPDLSLGTVYRNLNYFKEAGLAIGVGTVDGKERFDGNTAPHSHFICECCGKVLDVMQEPTLDEAFLGLVEGIGKAHSHRHLVYGLCRECSAAEQVSH